MKRNPRVCLGPTEIAGFYASLTAALNDLGVDAVHVNFFNHPYAYGEAAGPAWIVSLLKWSRRRIGVGRPLGPIWRIVERAVTRLFLCWLIARFDVFVFGFGHTFFDLRELPLLRLLRKQIVFVFHGSDARPRYLDGAVTRPGAPIAEVIAGTRAQKHRLRRIERYADAVICDPMICHLLERPVVLKPLVGCLVAPATRPGEPAGSGVRVLHAPSDPIGKGTAELRRIFAALRARGHEIELVELQGQPNRVVIEELARCDFAADQMYTDTPTSTLATEAASLGKPALVGGYARAGYEAVTQPKLPLLGLYVEPQEMQAAAEQLVSDPALRAKLGHEAQTLVSSEWSPLRVAERFLQIVNGHIPDEWMFDPATLRYTHGYGLGENEARELVRAVIEAGGVNALHVGDKPELQRALVRFAAGATPANASCNTRASSPVSVRREKRPSAS